MKVKAGLLIDLGNSETRFSVIVKKECVNVTLSNEWGICSEGYEMPEEYQDKRSLLLKDVNTGKLYTSGRIVKTEFRGSSIKPTAQSAKLVQDANLLSLQYVFCAATQKVAEMVEQDVSDVDVTYNISLLLPPEEQQNKGKQAAEMLRNMNHVELIYPETFLKFKVDAVRIVPEGLAAFIAACYTEENNKLVERDVNKPYLTGQSLIIDIGAGTTDMTRVEDCELILASRRTVQKGGNTVASWLKAWIKSNYGVTSPNMEQVVSEGVLTQGLDTINVSELVRQAKIKYAQRLREDIENYIEEQTMDIKTIKGILVTGGGSLPTVNTEGEIVAESMADLLLYYFKMAAPQLRQIDTSANNPRYMNLEGLRLMYKYL